MQYGQRGMARQVDLQRCNRREAFGYRMKIRAPSFVNLSIIPKLFPRTMISDSVAILGSLDFVMGECDR